MRNHFYDRLQGRRTLSHLIAQINVTCSALLHDLFLFVRHYRRAEQKTRPAILCFCTPAIQHSEWALEWM